MLSILEVCQMTGKSEKTIYRMMSSGKLAYTQVDGKRFVEREKILELLPNKLDIEKKDSLEQQVATLTNEVVRLSELVENLIERVTSSYQNQHNTTETSEHSKLTRQPKTSSNEIRAQKAKSKLFQALDKLQESNEIPMYRKAPSITGIHRITGIDRGTISKYLSEWLQHNPMK